MTGASTSRRSYTFQGIEGAKTMVLDCKSTSLKPVLLYANYEKASWGYCDEARCHCSRLHCQYTARNARSVRHSFILILFILVDLRGLLTNVLATAGLVVAMKPREERGGVGLRGHGVSHRNVVSRIITPCVPASSRTMTILSILLTFVGSRASEASLISPLAGLGS
jgi:hypothetical protein